MKKKIQKIILSLCTAASICFLPYSANAGWISQAYYCQVGAVLGVPVFNWVTICDAWGGNCPNQYCCDAYFDPQQ